MKKRGVLAFFSLIAILLLISISFAQEDEGPETGGSVEEKHRIEIEETLEQGGSTEVPESTTIQNKGGFQLLTVGPGTVSQQGGTVFVENLEKGTTDKGTVFESAKEVEIKDNGKEYTVSSVARLEQGPQVEIVNAVNVRWGDDKLTADSAEKFDFWWSESRDVVKLSAEKKEFYVEKAEKVQAGCFWVEDCDDAHFSVGRHVVMTTGGTGRVVYNDDEKLEYRAKTGDSKLAGSVIDCHRQEYGIGDMEVFVAPGNVVEIANGTGRIEMDPKFGIACVNLTPVSEYHFNAPKAENSFGFRISEYAYKLCIQKSITQKLESDCPLCGLVDLANKKVILNGVAEYLRYWYDSALISPEKQRAFLSGGFGKNIINLETGDVFVQENRPITETVASNYLEISEVETGKGTHRFLKINEKTDRIAENWARTHTTAYSPATTAIKNNVLKHKKAACTVAVLPPYSPEINAVLSSLNSQEVMFK